jgi:hypothetical protein
MKPTFSIVLNHTPWRPERAVAKAQMLLELLPLSRGLPFLTNDTDYRGTDWQVSKVAWALRQWEWSAEQATTHHVFLTDDLHLAHGFLGFLGAMVEAAGDAPAIGLLSNHPSASKLNVDGWRWYRTNSWLVGPAYVLSDSALHQFLAWFLALPEGPHTEIGTRAYRNDDSSINEWITRSGKDCAHPIPTIVEHRADLESTVGHGDQYSRERLSWRALRHAHVDGDQIHWTETPYIAPWTVNSAVLANVDFWSERGGPAASPLLHLPGQGA